MCQQVHNALYYSGHKWWNYDFTLPNLWSRTTKNSTSSLYWGKPGIVRLASMYTLYSIGIPPCPQDTTNPSVEDPQSTFSTEAFGEGRDSGPSIHQGCHLLPSTTTAPLLAWTISHTTGLGLWYLGSAAGVFALTNIPCFPSPDCTSWWAGWRCSWPPPSFHLKMCSDTHEPYAPNPHIKNI